MESEKTCYWCEKPIPRLRWVGKAIHNSVEFSVRFCTKTCMTKYTADAKRKYRTTVVPT